MDDSFDEKIAHGRKLSVSVQLSESVDYSGGELALGPGANASKALGNGIIFPACEWLGPPPIAHLFVGCVHQAILHNPIPPGTAHLRPPSADPPAAPVFAH